MADKQIVLNPGELIRSGAFNLMFAYLFSGQYEQKMIVWSSNNRPSNPTKHRTWGFNTDFRGMEIYMGDDNPEDGWQIISGIWTQPPDAIEHNLAYGSRGFNTEWGQSQVWNGTDWALTG